MLPSLLGIRWWCKSHRISVPVSKRINVTLPDAVYDELEWWAELQGRPVANLANFLIESSIRTAQERGEIPPNPNKKQPKALSKPNAKKRTPSTSNGKGAKQTGSVTTDRS